MSRSPNAARVFRDLLIEAGYDQKSFEVRSAGTNAWAGRTQMTRELGDWTNEIYAMDGMVALALQRAYGLPEESVVNLQVPDIYTVDDPVLERLLRNVLLRYVNRI